MKELLKAILECALAGVSLTPEIVARIEVKIAELNTFGNLPSLFKFMYVNSKGVRHVSRTEYKPGHYFRCMREEPDRMGWRWCRVKDSTELFEVGRR